MSASSALTKQITHLKVVNEVRNHKTDPDDTGGQQHVLEKGHVGGSMFVVYYFLLLLLFTIIASNLDGVSCMKDLVQANSAGLHLQWIREHNKNHNGQLPNSNEQRCRRIHRNNISADLWWKLLVYKLRQKNVIHIGTKGQIAENCDDLVYHDGTTNGSSHHNVHTLL